MDSSSSSLQTDVLLVVGGLFGLAVAAARFLAPIQYPTGDPRNEPSIQLAISIFIGVFALLFLVIGLIRLALRATRRR